LERLQYEHDNFRAALAWAREHHQTEIELRLAGSLWGFWHLRDFLSEGRGWLQAALAKRSDASPRLVADRAKALTGLGYLALHQGDYAAARAHFADTLAMFEGLDNKEGVANSLNNLGLVARHQGDHTQALANFERSLALFREIDGRQGISWALSNLGLLAMEQGDYEVARAYMTEGLAIVRELGNQVSVARALNNLGLAAYHQADYLFARICYEESLAIKRALNNKLGIPPTLYNLGSIALHQHDLTLAEAYTTEALALCWELGNREEIAIGLENMGAIVAAHGQHQRAAQLLATAAQLRLAIGAPLAPVDRVEHDRTIAAVRAVLGDAAFDQAWIAGRQMTLDQAVSYALDQVV
jgi:tetratricopeptide (TPR) repeat protein